MGKFKELRVWQDSMNLVVGVYKISRKGTFAQDYGLCRQIQRAAVSIPSNIAEGDERNSDRESVHFFNIAKGSTAEVITQIEIAYRIGYIDKETLIKFEGQAEKVRASLKNLIKARGGDNRIKRFSWLLLGMLFPI